MIRMLTRLRLKNWRSIKDETIDFTPITVFIGANSSGKTNILDAIRFKRDSLHDSLVQVVLESGYIRIQTDALNNNENVELEYTYDLPVSEYPVKQTMILKFEKRDVPFQYGTRLYEGDLLLREDDLHELPLKDVIEATVTKDQIPIHKRARELSGYLNVIIQKRWQILSDSFVPKLRLSQREGGDLYVIERDARNTLFMLDFMRNVRPDLYNELQEDLMWLLSHVTALEIWQQPENREIEVLIREEKGSSAPTISTGTARLLAMLTAIYALDMPQQNPYPIQSEILGEVLSPEMPGLVVIEEPDTALHPGLHKRFVEQLRNYVEGEHPRQFILTTHNPNFLDFFEPEEVRVVERDAQGYTHVRQIPDHIRDIWLDEYGLGEVWMTNSFGGVPE